jgi:hypothetical protein
MDTLVLLYFAESSFLCRFRVESVMFRFLHIQHFLHQQTILHMCKRFPKLVQSGRMNIGRVNIEFFPGWKKIKRWHNYFVLGYLRMILWKISTAISIKHRILAIFYINKKIQLLGPFSSFFFLLNKIEHHNITEILLKVMLNTMTLTLFFNSYFTCWWETSCFFHSFFH